MTTAQLIALLQEADPSGEANVVVFKPDSSLQWVGALDLIATPTNGGGTPVGSIGITTEGA